MATSGSFNSTEWTSSVDSSKKAKFTVEWTRSAVDVVENKSTINYSIKLTGSYSAHNLNVYNLKLDYKSGNDTSQIISLSHPGVYRPSEGSTIHSGSFSVTHNNDGTKTFSLYITGDIENSGKTKTGNGSWTLDPIARKSDFSINPSSFTVGDTVVINIDRKNANYTHKIYIGSDANPIATGVGTSYSWNTSSLLSRFASNSSELQSSLKVVTMNGSTIVGDVPHQFTATMPENMDTKPSASISVARHPGDIPSGIYFFIQNRSRGDVTVTAAGKYGATISSYRVELDGKVYDSATFTSDVITSSGSLFAKVTVTDSRGFTNTAYSGEIIVRGYYDPSLIAIAGESTIKVFRADASGNPDNAGGYVRVKVKREYSPTLLTANRYNRANVWWRRKETAALWQDDWEWLIRDDDQNDEYNALISVNNTPTAFDATKSYNVELLIEDDLRSETSIVFAVPSETVPLHLAEGGAGVGFGAYASPTPNTVKVGWDAYFDGDIYIYDSASQEYITLAQYIQNVIDNQ